jgi:hypothetical protein
MAMATTNITSIVPTIQRAGRTQTPTMSARPARSSTHGMIRAVMFTSPPGSRR